MLVLGLMSGTSADGIDVALARVEEKPTTDSSRRTDPENRRTGAQPRMAVPQRETLEHWQRYSAGQFEDQPLHVRRQLLGHVTLAMDRAVRKEVLRIAEGGACTAGEISQLNVRVGEEFAAAAIAACRKFRVSLERVGLIGSHGQTIFHQGTVVRFLGTSTASTLQIGEPAVIAARTGVPTVGDFRVADMAAGGQGAPLVPYVDWLLLRDEKVGRVALNLGGIGNVTVLGRELTADSKQPTDSHKRNPRSTITSLRRRRSGQAGGRDTQWRRAEARMPFDSAEGKPVPRVMAFDTGPGTW